MTDISGISFMLLQGPNSPAVPLKRKGFFKKNSYSNSNEKQKRFFQQHIKVCKGASGFGLRCLSV